MTRWSPEGRMAAAAKRHRRALDREAAERFAREETRIAKQREIFAQNLGPARAALEAAMLDRAWQLLDGGQCEACDALLEFVPEAAARALLDEYFEDEP